MEPEEKVNDISDEVEQKTPEEQGGKPRIVSKLEHALPGKGITKIEKLLDILKAYVVTSSNGSKAISYKDFNGVTDFNPYVISGTNKFLKEIGLIEPEKGQPGFFRPSKTLIEFQKQKGWGQEEEAKKILRDSLKTAWFVEAAEMVLCMNNPALESALLVKLGIESGAERGKHDGPIKSVLDLMTYAGTIQKNEDGTYSQGTDQRVMLKEVQAAQQKETASIEVFGQEERPQEVVAGPITPLDTFSKGHIQKQAPPVSIQLVFNIDNNTSPEKIKEVVGAIKEAMANDP